MKSVGVIGSFIIDLTSRSSRLPKEGETVKGSSFKMGAGGKGYNQAIAASRSGSHVLYSTKLGEDSFASFFKEEEMDARWVYKTDKASTGVALISVSETTSQNQIIVVTGASDTYSDEDIEKLDSLLCNVEYLLLQMEINMDALLKIIKRAYDKGVKVILNPAPAAPLEDEYYSMLYAVTPNETEAQFLSGKEKCETEDDYKEIEEFFSSRGVKNTIITLGSRGVYCNGKVLPPFKVKALDTTGAGDAFNGGFLTALSEGKTMEDSCIFGQATAAISVTRLGTSPAMPKREEIDEFLRLN